MDKKMDVKHIACGEELMGIMVTKTIDNQKTERQEKSPMWTKEEIVPGIIKHDDIHQHSTSKVKKVSLTHQSGILLQASVRVG